MLNYKLYLKPVILVLMILTSITVIQSAYIDLYDPGSLAARQYADIAMILMFVMCICAIPLWIDKIKVYQKWMMIFDSLDEDQKRIELKKISKPIIKQIILSGLLCIVAYYILTSYYQIPDEILHNYINYYHGRPEISDTIIYNATNSSK